MKQRWPRVPPGAAGATAAIAVILRPQVGLVEVLLPLCLLPETSLVHTQALQAVRGALAARGRPARGSLAVPTVAAALAMIRRPTSAARRRALYLGAAWVSPPRALLRVCRLKSISLLCRHRRIRRRLRACVAASCWRALRPASSTCRPAGTCSAAAGPSSGCRRRPRRGVILGCPK